MSTDAVRLPQPGEATVTGRLARARHGASTRDDRLAAAHRENHSDIVRYFIRRGAEDEADDLAAEVFVIAWRKLPPDPADARPWLFGVARKVLGNARRGHVRNRSLDVALDVDAPGLPARRGETGEIAFRLDLQHAWNRLAPADQEILALTAWEGLTAAEAAGVLGIRRSGAAMRLGRARDRLRALLEPDPEEESR